MLLARDGHEVIVLERDTARPPSDPAGAWERWQRPGLNQFRRGHCFLTGFRAVIDAELPGISRALQDAGGLRTNFLRDLLPAALAGGWRDGDERFEMVTGRRPMVEAVLATAAESAPGVEVRRGTSVTGLVTGASALSGVPHVTGVRTKVGELILADLVVDTSGRRSARPDWLEDVGARRPAQELEESGFVYDSADPAYQLAKALGAAGQRDPDCLRASLDIGSVLRPPEEVFARPGLRDKIFELGSGWREEQEPGPTREQLLALASAP